MNNKKALVIDGNSLMYRCFYASYKQLVIQKEKNFLPTNALKLFLMILLKLIKNNNYDYALVAFDHGKKTFRHDEFSEYKANRKPMPEELVSQIPLIKEAIDIVGCTNLSIETIEADDIIGSFCKLANKENIFVDIYTSDNDMLQLVNVLTSVNLFKTGISNIIKVDVENFSNYYHDLKPEQVCDFKGISGDSSDCLYGVKGIGEKQASILLKKYQTLENIYENLDELNETQKKKFSESKKSAFDCKKLAKIKCDVLNEYNINDFTKKEIDKNKLQEFISKYHFINFEKIID
ncbi:MAG: 5'-3' exonuclease [Mycoplasmataceae bacterium]|jgi:DNA polymerase-1|nr:5'-3' exonuclease [Mycoplasmataceae bacterium]